MPTTALVAAAEDLIERDGTGTDEQWEQLRRQFLDQYPVCPDCHASWDLDLAGEECEPLEGEISLTVPCPAYEAALHAGSEPPRHPTADGLIRETISIIFSLQPDRPNTALVRAPPALRIRRRCGP